MMKKKKKEKLKIKIDDNLLNSLFIKVYIETDPLGLMNLKKHVRGTLWKYITQHSGQSKHSDLSKLIVFDWIENI